MFVQAARRRRAPAAAAALVVAVLGASCTRGDSGSGGLTAGVERDLDAAVTRTMERLEIPGVAAGVWVGDESWVTAHGVADLLTRRRMTPDLHTRIGSITKTFTVTAVLTLVDDRTIGLDDPIGKYLPFVPNGENITIRMLAGMTSGLPNYSLDERWQNEIFTNPAREWAPRELVDVAFSLPISFPPGEGWQYSNTNTVLLGMMIEKVTGKDVATVFRERLYEPLGLEGTSFPESTEIPEPYTSGYTTQSVDESLTDATNRNPSWAFTAGQMISTLDDLRVWGKALATGELLDESTQRERLRWATFPPNTSEHAYGLGIGTDHGWLGHTGELPGFNTVVNYFPDRDATIVVVVNSDIAVEGHNPAPAVYAELARTITPDNVPSGGYSKPIPDKSPR